MSKKMIKKICLFALILVTFFGFSGNFKAYQTRALYPKIYGNSVTFKLKEIGKDSNGKLNGTTGSHSLNNGIYLVDGKHAYCIEPGVDINGTAGYDTNDSISLGNYTGGYFTTDRSKVQFVANDKGTTYYDGTTSDRRTLIKYILTFAENYGNLMTDVSDSNWNAKKGTLLNTLEEDKNRILRVFAAQGMIWEVVVGERASFNNEWPEYGPACSFYNVIHKKNGCISTNVDTAVMEEEYDSIVTDVQNAFYKQPGESSGGKLFKDTKLTANVVPLSYNSSTGKYTLTIYDSKFKYWEVDTSSSGTSPELDVNIGSNFITISSNEEISINDAKQVTIKVYNKNKVNKQDDNSTVYIDGSAQDIVVTGGTTRWAHIKVYTPNYQIRINKKASIDGEATSENLAGAKFIVCSDSSCRNVIGDPITTNSSGVATFDKIPAPGTYYVKETVAPPGYELDTTPHAITVSTSNVAGSGSYGSITITDEKKVFDLTKMTVDEDGNSTILDDGCGADTYTGPTFQLRQNGESLYFKPVKKDGVVVPGHYELASSDTEGATTELRTCNGRLRVYALTSCNYTISETKPPEGLALPSEPNRNINVCGSDKTISLTNGYVGLEFQKKNEDGVFLAGGKFSLQMKVNNVYRDVLLKELGEGNYTYDANLTEEDEGATYIITTKDGSEDGEEKGIARISKLPPGEYRIVEKEAPEGYELIEDKDSNAVITIKDTGADDYYIVEMIDQKVLQNGSRASAELVVTITTGRRVPNYVVIIASLAVLLVITIILRKRIKK